MSLRITAISLRGREGRWRACEQHMRGVLPPRLLRCFDMLDGTDASHITSNLARERALLALEREAGCKVWREWPITEVEEARRAFPSASTLSEGEAWNHYHRAISAVWKADRARLFVDFYFRFLTAGDVGACISHLRVAERGHAEGLALQLVFEDDSRPTAAAVPAMLEEVSKLEAMGEAWDVIYLVSAQYDRQAELYLSPGSRLLHAGHRKAHHAYALSARAMRKLATCGLRESVFPYDEFLPSLHSPHPRPDVMALPCVRAARAEGFVAFTFSEEDSRSLCGVAATGSDSKAGSFGVRSLLGDCGVEVGGEESEQPEREEAGEEGEVGELGFPKPVAYAALLAVDASGEEARRELLASMRRFSFGVIACGPSELGVIKAAEESCRAFFELPKPVKSALTAGGRHGSLPLWGCGFSSWPNREHWHVVLGAPNAQPWPDLAGSDFKGAMLMASHSMASMARCCLAALPGGEELCERLASQPCEEDPSVLDAFRYKCGADLGLAAGVSGEEGEQATVATHMAKHTDPGLLTLKRVSSVPGLQLFHSREEQWLAAEEIYESDHILVFAGEQLEVSAGISAAAHRVMVSPGCEPRLSLVYELRAADVALLARDRQLMASGVASEGSPAELRDTNIAPNWEKDDSAASHVILVKESGEGEVHSNSGEDEIHRDSEVAASALAIDQSVEKAALQVLDSSGSLILSAKGEILAPASMPELTTWAAETPLTTGLCVCSDEPLCWDERGALKPSELAAQLVGIGIEVRRWEGGEGGGSALLGRRIPTPELELPVLCSAAEHMRPCIGDSFCASFLPMRQAACDGVCDTCGYHVPPPRLWRCEACRLSTCAHCVPTSPLHQLSAHARSLLQADSTLPTLDPLLLPCSSDDMGEWPITDDAGRLFAWFLWTGSNEMPPYLSLCIESFQAKAGDRFAVRVVHPQDLEGLLGDVHEAFEMLSYVHRADYLRCELLHTYGGLYCDCDTICHQDLTSHVDRLAHTAAVLVSDRFMMHDAGINIALCRRDSLLTRCWRAALHARLDARLHSLRNFRQSNADPMEDALSWHEILRDIVSPLCAALMRSSSPLLSWSIRAYNWCPEPRHGQEWGMTPGFDPLQWEDAPVLPADTQVVVLNNNHYGERVKRVSRAEMLRSRCVLGQWLRIAVVTYNETKPSDD